MHRVEIDIITCPQWGAHKPRSPIQVIKKAPGIIFHHTAGHHKEIENPKDESLLEAIRYAQAIQRAHMAPGGLGTEHGGIDSGHNFLVCRNGVILQGRWLTVSAIESGHMVASAHCPDYNHWIGIEHEHLGTEPMTQRQRLSSARLMAWISYQYGLGAILRVDPHSAHFRTQCPANLKADIPAVRAIANDILHGRAY